VVVVFKGKVLSVSEMIRLSDETEPAPTSTAGVLHTAAGNARRATELVAEGEPATVGWRFAVLQTLDDYTSTCPGAARNSELRSSHLRPSQRHPLSSTLHLLRCPSTLPSSMGALPRPEPPTRGARSRRQSGGRRRRASTAALPLRRARARSVTVASGSPSAASPARKSASDTGRSALLRARKNCSAPGPDLVELVLHKGGSHG
jgi:hypothetical protein